MLDPDSCYRALKTHDARFDGRFFVGVSSTRIYCRPVCTVKTPRRENCTFYASASAAEEAGYRPCLRCRPELAPGNAPIDAVGRLAQATASCIEDGLLDEAGVDELAERLRVSDRHLRRVFHSEFGVSPLRFAQTQRLLLAKRLLADTGLSVTEVAFASGFSSLRRFNTLFKERYRLRPSQLRQARGRSFPAGLLTFELAYRPPLDWEGMLSFLAARAIPGVEAVAGRRYQRTVCVAARGSIHRGWITVAAVAGKPTLRLDMSASLAKAVPPVLAGIKRLFDLGCDPTDIASHLGELAATNPGMRVPGAFDGFEMAVRAILGQQITVKAATTLAGRFAAALGDPIETPHASLTRVFPAAATVARARVGDLAALGIVRTRAEAVRNLARAVSDGSLRLDPGADVEPTLEKLMAIPGIGPWTAQYLAMRALGWPDAFPDGDAGVMKALRTKSAKRALEISARWRPWRAYAVMHLWRSLEVGT